MNAVDGETYFEHMRGKFSTILNKRAEVLNQSESL